MSPGRWGQGEVMIKAFRVIAGGALVWAVAFFGSQAQAACIGAGVVDDINDCLQVEKGKSDCLLAWSVNFDGAGGPPPDEKKITCVDGAPCDADGHINGSCTFEIGACVNTTFAGCSNFWIDAPHLTRGSFWRRNPSTMELPSLSGSSTSRGDKGD